MKDTFTRRQWVEYTCGAAPVELQVAIEDHVSWCGDCRETSRMFAHVDRELIAAATIFRDSLSGLESSGERAYEVWRQERLPAWENDHVSRRIVPAPTLPGADLRFWNGRTGDVCGSRAIDRRLR